jgi:hypothetical protein
MADLLDIAPSTAVDVVKTADGQRVKVYGLHGNAIASIAARFPRLMTVFGDADDGNVSRLIGQLGDAIGPIIAAGCGHLAVEKYERHAAKLLAEDQFKLVVAIYRLTFPNGLASFFEAMAHLLNGAEEKVVRVRLRKSPSASPPSSDADSRPTMQ